MAAPPPQASGLLLDFSHSVRAVAAELAGREITAWELADELLAIHPEYGGSPLRRFAATRGRREPLERWLVLVASLIDLGALRASPARVIDGRMTLLALARLEPELGLLFRRLGIGARLADEVALSRKPFFRAWALPQRPSAWVERAAFGGPETLAGPCALSPDGTLLVIASVDGDSYAGPRPGTARVWDVASGTERGVLRGHEADLTCCTFSPDGSLLLTTSEDTTARLWDVASGNERAVLRGHDGVVRWCAFSPDGSMLATAGRDGTARLWDVFSGVEQSVLPSDEEELGWCAFSPDGTVLATRAGFSTAELWDVASGSKRSVLRGHRGFGACAFGPDGGVFATANGDGTARLWDVASGLERSVLRHGDDLADDVTWCAFSPSGGLLITAARARFPSRYVVRLWQQTPLRRSPPDTPESPDFFGDDIATSLRLRLGDAARAGLTPAGIPEPIAHPARMASPDEYERMQAERAERDRRQHERRQRERRQLERAVALPRSEPTTASPAPASRRTLPKPAPYRRASRAARLAALAISLGSVAAGFVIAKWLLGWFAAPPNDRAAAPEAAAAEPDTVECTVFAPSTAAPRDSVLVQVFVHRADEAADAKAIAAELDTAARRRAYRSLTAPVIEGSRLDFELRMPGLVIDDPVTSLVWRGRTEAVQFGVEVPRDTPTRSVIGTLDVSLDGAPVGHLKFTLRVEKDVEHAAVEPQGEQAGEYSYAFISYSSDDRDEVLSRVQMLSLQGIDYFQDVMTLEPGDRWHRKLEAGIDRCDLFLLFWSKHAKESSWVKREVEYALARKGGDEFAAPEIRPVILERVEPWAELSHLHFDDRVLYFMRRPDAGRRAGA